MKNNVICLLDGGYHYLLTYAHQDWLEKQFEKLERNTELEDLEHEANWNDDNSFTADDIPF
jgi:hypothetical protein